MSRRKLVIAPALAAGLIVGCGGTESDFFQTYSVDFAQAEISFGQTVVLTDVATLWVCPPDFDSTALMTADQKRVLLPKGTTITTGNNGQMQVGYLYADDENSSKEVNSVVLARQVILDENVRVQIEGNPEELVPLETVLGEIPAELCLPSVVMGLDNERGSLPNSSGALPDGFTKIE